MKKITILLLALVLSISCLSALAENKVVRVAASANPHEIILNFVKDDLAKLGFDLQVTWVDGYVLQNQATSAGEYEANFFQHRPYLNGYNASVSEEEQLVAAIPVHYEPFGLYPGAKKSLDELQDGDSIAVPNDPSNETRALLLLADQGIITLPEGTNAASSVTSLDVKPGSKDVKIVEVEAERLPGILEDVAFAVINGNYAIAAGFSPSQDALALEGADSDAAITYTNYVVVRAADADSDFVKALTETLHNDKVSEFLKTNEDFKGGVVPNFAFDKAD